jgi:hypothetical protein
MTDNFDKEDSRINKLGIKSLNRAKDIFNLFDKNQKGCNL